MLDYWQIFPLASFCCFLQSINVVENDSDAICWFWFLLILMLLLLPGKVLICFPVFLSISFVPHSWRLVVFPVPRFSYLPIFLGEFS